MPGFINQVLNNLAFWNLGQTNLRRSRGKFRRCLNYKLSEEHFII
jgi:hypothetical protein